MTPEQMEAVAKSSPLVLLILLVLWQYRRDFTKLFQQANKESIDMKKLLTEVVEALVGARNAIESNRKATEENTAVIKRYFSDDSNFQKQRSRRD